MVTPAVVVVAVVVAVLPDVMVMVMMAGIAVAWLFIARVRLLAVAYAVEVVVIAVVMIIMMVVAFPIISTTSPSTRITAIIGNGLGRGYHHLSWRGGLGIRHGKTQGEHQRAQDHGAQNCSHSFSSLAIGP